MTSKVLICRSNPVAPDPRVEKVATALTGVGYQVSILCWDRSASLPREDQVAGVPCRRLSIQAEYATGIRNLPDLIRWQWGLLRWLAGHRREYDLIHACDFDTVLPALVMKILYRKGVIYDIFDFYADHLRATPSLAKKAIRTLDRWAINRVDGLILADDSRWEQIEGARPRASAVIYNSPQDLRDSLRNQTSPPASGASLRLAYVGLLQLERGLLELLEALGLHPEWSLDLAGFGGDQARLTAQIKGMANVRWHGRVPYAEALRLSQAADVLLATYDPAIPNHRYSSPNKIFEAMMLGKPVIVAKHTNMDRIIRNADCGLVVPYGQVSALESALQRLDSDPQLRERLGCNGRKAYEETYSWPRMQERLVRLYGQVGGSPRAGGR
jgi:glycosyltransferase involved in cell wall biosynthesis